MPPFPESPRCLSPFQGNLFSWHCLHFQAEDRLTNRCHVGQPCGKASLESLVGKPPGKATDPLILEKGSVTLLLQLWRKAHVPPWCESILGLKVEVVQGKQVSLEWIEISGGLWEWWHDPGVPLAFPVESASS